MNADLSLGDVSSATMVGLWMNIYDHLPVEDQLRGMLVCKAFYAQLPSLVRKIRIKVAPSQSQVDGLSRFTNCEALSIIPADWECDRPFLDFSRMVLPKLESLTAMKINMQDIHFTRATMPLLASLVLDNVKADRFLLDLPRLTAMSLDFVEVCDDSAFASSLAACPALESLLCYKLWGIEGPHKLSLPSCTCLDLYRSDSLVGLGLDAPKLESLNLRACYSLEMVALRPEEGPPVSVNLVNANISRKALAYLKAHPRVRKAGGGIQLEADDEGYY